MRIEVVVDVKTTSAKARCGTSASSGSTGSTASAASSSAPPMTAAKSAPGTCPPKIGSIAIRKDGNGAICSLANGFHALDFKTGDCTLIHDPEPDKPEQPHQ